MPRYRWPVDHGIWSVLWPVHLQGGHDAFECIRGTGLLLGVGLQGLGATGRDVLRKCTGEGLLILMAVDNLLRFAPTLTIGDDQIHRAVEMPGDALVKTTDL